MLAAILLGLIPVHILYINNMKECNMIEYIATCAIISTILSCFYIIFSNFFSLETASFLTLITWGFIYSQKKMFLKVATPFQLTRKHIKNSLLIAYIALWMVTVLTINYALTLANINIINKSLNYIAFILTALIGITIFSQYAQNQKQKNESLNEIKEKASLNFEDNTTQNNAEVYPDIYHIILDAHPGFNNPEYTDEKFRNELLKRNFKIFDNHYSNYDYTTQSIPSLLQMEYFKTSAESEDTEENNNYIHWSSLTNNLFKYLLSKSYNLNIIHPNYRFGTNLKLADNFQLYTSKCHPLNKLRLLNMIKFNCGLKFKAPFYFINTPNEILFDFDKITTFTKRNKPSYNFVHILAPHAPNWFYQNGKKSNGGVAPTFEYIKFCNNMSIKAIDKIQKNNPDAIIIVHSDHGIMENEYRYRILSTIYIPDRYSNSINLPERLTLVNLFRYIINGLFEEKLSIKEDKFFHMDYPQSSKIEEINNQFKEFGQPYYKTK